MQERDPRHERENGGIGKPALIELIDERIAIDQGHGRGIRPVHLRGDDLAWMVRPADIEMAFPAHPHCQSLQIFDAEAAGTQFEDAVDRRVRARAGGIGLQTDQRGFPAFAQSVQHGGGIELAAQRAQKTAERRLERFKTAGEASLREAGTQHAALRGPAGVKTFGHRAKSRHVKTRGLRRADPERVRKLHGRKRQGARCSGGRADRADGAGDVVAAGRMSHAGADPEAQADLVADGERGQELFAGSALHLCGCETGGQRDGAWMKR